MIEGINQTTQLVIGVCTAVALSAGAYKVLWYGTRNPRKPGWVKAGLERVRSAFDAILGREAVVDSITGKELAPALPGIGQRMSTVEQALVTFAQNQHELEIIRDLTKEHGERLTALEEASVERVVSKAESAAAWRAMEAATKATPDEVVEPD